MVPALDAGVMVYFRVATASPFVVDVVERGKNLNATWKPLICALSHASRD
jgi:hypothetical protein